MENVLSIVDELLKDNNYKKSGNYEETKPDGDYLCNIDSIALKESETGTQWINFVLTVLDGDYVEEKFYVNYWLTEKSVKGSITKIMQVISSFGYTPSVDMFETYDILATTLSDNLVNSQVKLNKKTSAKGFINYTLDGGVVSE